MFAIRNLLRFLLIPALSQSNTGSPGPPEDRSAPKCKSPTVRKEWRTLTSEQKENWITAFNCLTNLPRSGKLIPTVFPGDIPPLNVSGSWYDDFIYVHMDLNSHIHHTGLFFPWHRYYLWSYEQSLKQLCRYTGVSPYWNWAQDAPNFAQATILSDSNPKSGLGGWGNDSLDYVVTDGGFSSLRLAYPIPHRLRRQYTPYPFIKSLDPRVTDPNLAAASTFTQKEVNYMVKNFKGDFKGFQSYFEMPQGAHSSVHLIVGGDLWASCPAGAPVDCAPGPKWSPNEPMFWLHHAMVDKLWYDWQHKSADNSWAFEAGTIQDPTIPPQYQNGAPPAMHFNFSLPTDGILPGDYTVGDMFNTTSGPLCYVYDSESTLGYGQ